MLPELFQAQTMTSLDILKDLYQDIEEPSDLVPSLMTKSNVSKDSFEPTIECDARISNLRRFLQMHSYSYPVALVCHGYVIMALTAYGEYDEKGTPKGLVPKNTEMI